MTDWAIRASNLGKQYRLGAGAPDQRLAEVLQGLLVNTVRAPFRSREAAPLPTSSARGESFWALQDASFEIKQGEALGIIGRNGAGKSTLLKILSRITEPTTGRAEIRGRVGSLLEVGTGFHPELSGRENIFLNGAVLGMDRATVKRKFDEIVAFSEVEKFLDTPVKRYSSGMYMRLAFAVAAHLEPEILVVDEVLAVGDAAFQKKCLQKMKDVGRDGRTILFISHNMLAVTRLCPRAILLEGGRIQADGNAEEVVRAYLRTGVGVSAGRQWTDPATAPGNHVTRLRSVRIRTEETSESASVNIRHPVGLEMEFDVLQDGWVLSPNFHLYNDEGICIFVVGDTSPEWINKPRPVGRYTSTAWVPPNFFAEGTILVNVAVSTVDPVMIHFHVPEAVAFQVVDTMDGDSARGNFAGTIPGIVRPKLKWTTQFEELDATSPQPEKQEQTL